MAVTEESRHRLYVKLEDLIGSEDAATMMELVPPVGWGDVATRRDLESQIALTRQDLEAQMTLTRRDLESQITQTRQHLETQIAQTRQHLETQITLTRREIEGLGDRLRTEWSRQAVAMVISIVTANTAMTALIVSVDRFAG